MYKKEKKEHGFQVFSREIKAETIAPVVFFYGEEGYLIRWAAETLVNRFVEPSCKTLDYVHFRDEGETATDLVEAAGTYAMLSKRRIVWADNFAPLRSGNVKGFTAADLERLLAYIQEPNPSTIFIFSTEKPEMKSELVKALIAQARCYCFDRLDRAALSGFLQKRLKLAGKTADRELLRMIIEQSGYFNKESMYNLDHFVGDLTKVIAYAGDGPVTADIVSEVLCGDMDKFVFHLLDAVSGGQKEQAFNLLHNILDTGKDAFSVTALLINQFELLLEVAECKAEGMRLPEIVAVMKSSEFRIRKAMGFTEKFTVDKLKTILCELYEIDRNMKTGLLDQDLALELVLGRM